MGNLVDLIAQIRHRYEVILVSSGAVVAGFTKLPLDKRDIANKQALAAIGQPLLMRIYKEMFAEYDTLAAQILVTSANFESSVQTKRIRDTIETLLANDVIPIVNENDATATQELELGDNDQLSAYVAHRLDASLLVILSDIAAYYDKDPNRYDDAKMLLHVSSIGEEELQKEATPHGEFATGGIVTKLKAAEYMLRHNRAMFLSSGFDLTDVRSFLKENKQRGGTLFSKEKE